MQVVERHLEQGWRVDLLICSQSTALEESECDKSTASETRSGMTTNIPMPGGSSQTSLVARIEHAHYQQKPKTDRTALAFYENVNSPATPDTPACWKHRNTTLNIAVPKKFSSGKLQESALRMLVVRMCLKEELLKTSSKALSRGSEEI